MKISVSIHLSPKPGIMPITGSVNFGLRTNTPKPARAMPAPARPPIKACDEELGNPSHQVIRFQVMAPMSAARITYAEACLGSMMPLAIALATAVPKKNAAAKLKNAAQTTASLGDKTLVDTTVAMLLAAS